MVATFVRIVPTTRIFTWILAAIGLAKLYPILGANYLQPNITSDWIAVVLIFFLSGLSLRTSEIVGAVSSHWRFHLVVQLFSLGVVPAVVYGITRLLLLLGDFLARPLADGMVICACLPMTINMVMVLTKAAGGDDASALVGAVVGNGVGVILSPLLILAYLGIQGNVNVGEVFIKLALRVLLPVIVGQVLQKTTNVYEALYQPHKKVIAKMQQLLLGTFRDILLLFFFYVFRCCCCCCLTVPLPIPIFLHTFYFFLSFFAQHLSSTRFFAKPFKMTTTNKSAHWMFSPWLLFNLSFSRRS
jgi:predicted Na+-dependent transporter